MLAQLLENPAGWEAFNERLPQEPHPIYPTLSRDIILGHLAAGMAEEEIVGAIQKRAQLIEAEKLEPIYFGWEPEMWRKADALWAKGREMLVLGGNRSGKSTYAAKRVIQTMMSKPGCLIWCFSTSFETSVRDQQRLIHHYMPQVWRQAKRTKVTNVSYSVKRGFTDKAFIAPNGSECRFMNYTQDADVIEGGQVDLWWADELIPADWIVTLRSRVVDRRGRGLVTQTPIRGYTPTVAEYLNGAKVTEWADCPELSRLIHWKGGRAGKVPVSMSCLNKNNCVFFFHSKHNPYVDYSDLVSAWKDKGTANILCRLYGVTSGLSNCQFPRFGSHNIVKHEEIPKEGSNYHIVDFSWGKPWAMLWVRVRRVGGRNLYYIYRDWPDLDTFGEWVLRSEKPDGAPGPAQHPIGYGITEYKKLIYDLEGHREPGDTTNPIQPEVIVARFGDPRSGSATTLEREGSNTIFQMLEEDDGQEEPMTIEPVPGRDGAYHIREGVNLVNELLAYDQDREINQLNCPALYVSEKCGNLIECMRMWTGAGGTAGASKDFVDLVRYLAMIGPSDIRGSINLYDGGAY